MSCHICFRLLLNILIFVRQEFLQIIMNNQSDTLNDLILFAGHCDLYFMVQ